MTTQSIKPFSMDYVLRTTTKNMLRAVNLSLSKTESRIPELMEDSAKSLEAFKTLGTLQTMRKDLEKSLSTFKE